MNNICSTCKHFIKFLGNGHMVMCSDDPNNFLKIHSVRPVAERLSECNDWEVCNNGTEIN